MVCDGVSPLLLLGALWQRLHVELSQVPAVLVPAQVPLSKQTSSGYDRFKDNLLFKSKCVCSLSRSVSLYLSKPHAVPLVGRLLRLGRVHQLEARLILLMEVGVLTTASKLRGVLIWRQIHFIVA